MAKHDNRMPIQTALGYVEEARAASRDWRAKSWRDHEMYDGDQWTPEDRQRAVDAGIDPLTINRIFPAINLILGSQELNRANIIAKARTAKDGQIAEIMTGYNNERPLADIGVNLSRRWCAEGFGICLIEQFHALIVHFSKFHNKLDPFFYRVFAVHFTQALIEPGCYIIILIAEIHCMMRIRRHSL